jgi:hypothetical protein
VLGVIAGVDNTRGIVGIAPAVASVRVVSHYEAAGDTALHVAQAIFEAIKAQPPQPPPHVLLLEVQRDGEYFVYRSPDALFVNRELVLRGFARATLPEVEPAQHVIVTYLGTMKGVGVRAPAARETGSGSTPPRPARPSRPRRARAAR